jgi:hypothetical protein
MKRAKEFTTSGFFLDKFSEVVSPVLFVVVIHRKSVPQCFWHVFASSWLCITYDTIASMFCQVRFTTPPKDEKYVVIGYREVRGETI